jgi:hypothetical protein
VSNSVEERRRFAVSLEPAPVDPLEANHSRSATIQSWLSRPVRGAVHHSAAGTDPGRGAWSASGRTSKPASNGRRRSSNRGPVRSAASRSCRRSRRHGFARRDAGCGHGDAPEPPQSASSRGRRFLDLRQRWSGSLRDGGGPSLQHPAMEANPPHDHPPRRRHLSGARATVHQRRHDRASHLPSSQHPERFWDPTNLQASCAPCNHHGANVKHENRINRQKIAALERVIEEQQAVIEQLVRQLAEYEGGVPAEPARPRVPRIY